MDTTILKTPGHKGQRSADEAKNVGGERERDLKFYFWLFFWTERHGQTVAWLG